MTLPVLNDSSAPANVALIRYDAATLHRLLYIPEGHTIDAVFFNPEGAELVVSGPQALLTEPGDPLPLMQVVAAADEAGCCMVSKLIPANEEIGA